MPQPQKHIRARIIRIVIALVLVAAAVCTLPLPWRVNRELEGYRWTRGNVVQPMTVHVEGWYLRFLLRENLFYGWFYMDGVPYMRTLHRWIGWDDNWFEDTAEFKWLQKNAADYGFIMRYPEDKQDITKVIYEPWHWRYVGVETAKALNESGQVLEEYMGVAQ